MSRSVWSNVSVLMLKQRTMRSTSLNTWGFAIIAAALISLPVGGHTAVAQADQPKIIYDAGCYMLDAQHGEKRAFEGKQLD
jgi:hypothetical protein